MEDTINMHHLQYNNTLVSKEAAATPQAFSLCCIITKDVFQTASHPAYKLQKRFFRGGIAKLIREGVLLGLITSGVNITNDNMPQLLLVSHV